MKRYPKRIWALSVVLAGLAGYVDALGFLYLGGFFVSFMSGNSTRLGIGIAINLHEALIAGGLIFTFVIGVLIGTIVNAKTRYRMASLWLETTLLFAAAAVHAFGSDHLAIPLMVMAMGTENTLFHRDGEVSIGLTYMTGTLVKTGQHLAWAILGQAPWGWVPYTLLWLGLIVGGAVGSMAFMAVGLQALWGAFAAAVFCTIWATIQGIE
ncbi:MAG: DUF1275 domain-containing protein [Xanthobacteraceae bacterium]|nr:DUF1275 domain-containing protein [Xanthobacteraceae bacterium]